MRVHHALNCGRAITLCWKCKQRHQCEIDDDSLQQRDLGSRIDRLRNPETGDEADRVKDGDEKHDIGQNAVKKCN